MQRGRVSDAEPLARSEAGDGVGRFPIVGESEPMMKLHRHIRLAGPSHSTVLIVGETGTGKELVARNLHDLSPRSRRSFVAVNCAAIPEGLVESELFGHDKGAFTGATSCRIGYFEQANGGTLFLDELSAMPLSQQAKLLRVLQDGRFRRVGGEGEIEVDVRVIAAMNVPPERAIEEGRLREDLYYRLGVFVLRVPPLRRRGTDISRLAAHFARTLSTETGSDAKELDDEAVEALQRHRWPGNVRELRNAMERAVILAQGKRISVADLPPTVTRSPSSLDGLGDISSQSKEKPAEPRGIPLQPSMTLSELKKRLIVKTLQATGHNVTRASRALGISSRSLYNKIREWDLPRSKREPPPTDREAGGFL